MSAEHLHDFQKKTGWVVILTALTMVVEIYFGLSTNSMALLADGIHMASHVLAIGISWLAYWFFRRAADDPNFRGDSKKILSLAGYTSGLMLLIFVLFIITEAVKRFFEPELISYSDAILVAIIGLIVNIVSAFLLHHDHDHSDHNIRAAYLHVLADALTSFSAILGLIAAKIWDLAYIDTIAALLSSAVIIKWSIGLLRQSGKVLLDMTKPNN
jgi:cation diffusion facilitator family transporter